MQTLYLLIGTNSLFLYEKADRRFNRQYVNGSPEFPCKSSCVAQAIDHLQKDLVNEYNLDTRAELEFVVIRNRDLIRSQTVENALGEFVVETHDISDTLTRVLEKLSRDKSLRIEEFGVNFDGQNYRWDGKALLQNRFSLLAYPLCEDKLMDLMN